MNLAFRSTLGQRKGKRDGCSLVEWALVGKSGKEKKRERRRK